MNVYIPTLCSCDMVWKEAAFFLFSLPPVFVSEAERKIYIKVIFKKVLSKCRIRGCLAWLPISEPT